MLAFKASFFILNNRIFSFNQESFCYRANVYRFRDEHRGGCRMADHFKVEELLVEERRYLAEPIFCDRKPGPRILSGIIKGIKAKIERKGNYQIDHLYQYQDLTVVDDKYYLLRNIDGPTLPLKEYLQENRIKLKQAIDWLYKLTKIYRQVEEQGGKWNHPLISALWINKEGQLEVVDPEITELVLNYRGELRLDLSQRVLRPPEVIKGGDWDTQSRMYTLGILFYYLICGTTPYLADDNADLTDKILMGESLEPIIREPNLSKKVNDLLFKLLKRDKKERYNHWEELQSAIETIISEEDYYASKEEEERNIKRSQKVLRIKKRKNTILRFFKKYKVGLGIGLLVIAIFVGTSFISPGPDLPTIDKKTSPGEIINYLYQGIEERNIPLIEAVSDKKATEKMLSWLGQVNMVERIREFGPVPSMTQVPGQDVQNGQESVKEIFSIKDMKIKKLTENPPTYKVSYSLIIHRDDEEQVFQLEDKVKLEKKDGVWTVVKYQSPLAKGLNEE